MKLSIIEGRTRRHRGARSSSPRSATAIATAIFIFAVGISCSNHSGNADSGTESATGCGTRGARTDADGQATPLRARDIPIQLGDLEQIEARGTLRVLVPPAGEEFLPRRGMPAAAGRELASQLAARLGVKLQLAAVESHDQLIDWLNEGRGDLIAAQLTATDRRREKVAFSRPLATVSEWVVTSKRGADKPKTLGEAQDLVVHVRPSSSFAETLKELEAKGSPMPRVVYANERLDTETLVYDVSRRKLPATVVDSDTLEAIEAYNSKIQRLFKIAEGRHIAWAVRHESKRLKAAADAFLIENALTGHTQRRFVGDLDGIQERGVLRVLTRNNPVTYFLHRGTQMGFDFELSRMLARTLGVRLEMVVPPSRDKLIPWLLEGRGDVIAASMTATAEREKRVAFSVPYLYVDEVVVQRAGTTQPVAGLADLKGRRIHVRKSSSHYQTLAKLQRTYGPFELVDAPEAEETEDLIGRVASGDIELTVADSHILEVEVAYSDAIAAGAKLVVPTAGDVAEHPSDKPSKAIAFAVRPTAAALKATVDDFVRKTYRGLEFNMARTRYFKNTRRIAGAKEGRAGKSGRLSPFDGLLKLHASSYALDWRLMAAQAYQESRFDPNVKSWAGALGLFQVMPATGREMGFDDLSDPEIGIHAGIKYMHGLIARLDPSIPFRQRLRFALASYNVGYGHVRDAQRLALEQGLDPNRWFGQVETTMRLLEQPKYYKQARYGYCRGSEPVAYVSQIQNRYEDYVKLVKN